MKLFYLKKVALFLSKNIFACTVKDMTDIIFLRVFHFRPVANSLYVMLNIIIVGYIDMGCICFYDNIKYIQNALNIA